MRRYILFVVFFCGLQLIGCAWTSKQFDYQAACVADPQCLSDAKNKASVISTVAGVVNPIAGAAAGAGALAFFLWLGGKKKEKKDE